MKLCLFLRREGQSEEEIASSSHCVKRPRLVPTLARCWGGNPRPQGLRAPGTLSGAKDRNARVWCLFAPPQGFGEFRVPVLGEKGLKAHLDLSPEAGPVAEVRSLSQQNPGCGQGSRRPTGHQLLSYLQEDVAQAPTKILGALTGVRLALPLTVTELRVVHGPAAWPWDLSLSTADATGWRTTLPSLVDPQTATSAARSPRV